MQEKCEFFSKSFVSERVDVEVAKPPVPGVSEYHEVSTESHGVKHLFFPTVAVNQAPDSIAQALHVEINQQADSYAA